MSIVFVCGLFAVVIGSPALLGVWLSRLWFRQLPNDAEIREWHRYRDCARKRVLCCRTVLTRLSKVFRK